MTSIIERLKQNTSAFGLMDAELRAVAEKIGVIALEYYSPFFGDGWSRSWSSGKIDDRDVIRLRADYQCQHPEKTQAIGNEKWLKDHPHTAGPTGYCNVQHRYFPDGINDNGPCPWCGAGKTFCLWCLAEIPTKMAGWVEVPVSQYHHRYAVKHPDEEDDANIDAAPGMVGFGGIAYLAPCDCPLPDAYSDHLTGFLMTPPEPCEVHGPYVPQKARFWKEATK